VDDPAAKEPALQRWSDAGSVQIAAEERVFGFY
jgi:hypothetical protein